MQHPLLKQAKERARSQWVLDNGRGNYVHRETMRRWVRAVLRRAGLGLDRACCHAFRHAFNNNLRQTARGYDNERKMLMGHSLARVDGINAVYQHYSIPQLAEVINRIYSDAPILPR